VAKKQEQRRIVLRIANPEVSPELVSLTDLANMLKTLEDAVVTEARARDIDPTKDIRLGLVGVKGGSNTLSIACSLKAYSIAHDIADVVTKRTYEKVAPETQRRLHDLSVISAKRKWKTEMTVSKAGKSKTAVISEGDVIPLPMGKRIQGTTSLFGHCIRAGGKEPRASIRLHWRDKLLHIDVDKRMAQQLGKRLYEDIVIEGTAVWDSRTWDILEFTASSIGRYKKTDAVTAFKELAEAAGGRWDNVDAEEYVRGLRDEDE
jgi:hypothetical protein